MVSKASDNFTLLRAAMMFSAVLVAIESVASIWYSPIWWGINIMHFLPPPWLILYILLSLAAIIAGRSTVFDRALAGGASLFDRRPVILVGATIALFVGAAYLLRVGAPLLGDSFVLINNYRYTFDGSHRLNITREPLALIYFYLVGCVLPSDTFRALRDVFLHGEILLGIAVIIMNFFLVREFVQDAGKRFLLFLFLLVLPSMQLFWGYIEIYSVVVFSLTLFLLVALRYWNGKTSFPPVCAVYYLLFATHIVAVILLPAMAWLGYQEWKRNRLKHIFIGIGLVLLLFGASYAALGGHLNYVLPEENNTHYLSPFPVNDGWQAYTLFSGAHFIEFTNQILLVAPFLAFFIGAILMLDKRVFIASPRNIFLSLAALFPLLFLFIAKFDLGMSNDWDVTAPWILLAQLAITAMFLQVSRAGPGRSFVFIIAITLLHSAHWFGLNSTVEPAIDREKSLFETGFFSPQATYLATMHLTGYYYNSGNPEECIAIWEKYTKENPSTANGFENLISGYYNAPDTPDTLIDDAYYHWIETTHSARRVVSGYVSFCLNAANKRITKNDTIKAAYFYRRALQYDSMSYVAYNNLAKFENDRGNRRIAIELLKKSVAANPDYVEGWMNLGSVAFITGEYTTAARAYNRAIEKDSGKEVAYTYLSTTYREMHDDAKAQAILALRARNVKKDVK